MRASVAMFWASLALDYAVTASQAWCCYKRTSSMETWLDGACSVSAGSIMAGSFCLGPKHDNP